MSNKSFLVLFCLIIISCKQENKFVLNDNLNEIDEIILSVISQDSLNVTKNNSDNKIVIEYLKKQEIIAPKAVPKDSLIFIVQENQLVINDLFKFWQIENSKGFDKKDSLYLLSQNVNPDSLRISNKLLNKVEHLKLSETFDEIEKGNYKKYFTFSIPIISKDKNKAYIESSYRCGGLCGNGRAYFLEKVKGKWKVVYKWGTWIS
ncbi:MAG: hypothetical protein L6262_06790 [Weeksellaceae bacterium]|nr:hypothetical protein [Weeksellaceae bacterium]